MSYAEAVRVSMMYEQGLQAGAMEEHYRLMTSPHVSDEAKREVDEDFHRRHKPRTRVITNPATKGYSL